MIQQAEDREMIKIDEFMTADPYTLRENDSLSDARKVMTERHIRHIPITDDDNHLLGLVTQRDVLSATALGSTQQTRGAPQKADNDIMLSDIMIRDVSVIHRTDSLRQAALYIQSHKYGCLPVLSSNRLVGIITDSDFIDIAINLLEQVEMKEDEDMMDIEAESEQAIDDIELPAAEEAI
ncbi:MAG: CBS domain-containing protein [Gammaproteobacteria bacterium]|nr:CBS domain-containing protein [Gammaproteobacteria bacterium]